MSNKNGESDLNLSLLQRVKLRLFGHVSIGYRVKPGWRAPIMHYAFRCRKHGLVVDYAHGFAQRLSCPLCFEEESRVG